MATVASGQVHVEGSGRRRQRRPKSCLSTTVVPSSSGPKKKTGVASRLLDLDRSDDIYALVESDEPAQLSKPDECTRDSTLESLDASSNDDDAPNAWAAYLETPDNFATDDSSIHRDLLYDSGWCCAAFVTPCT